jgi:hypothetical protein
VKIADLRTLDPSLARHLGDAKEALVDALLNITWQRCSGDGPDGEIVFGTKPSLRFVSGFLLPRFEESGQQDETSDIHLSTLGLDCQIAAPAHGTVTVHAGFSIYVRVLPTWQDLTAPHLDLFPNPPLRRDLEQTIRDTVKQRLTSEKELDAQKPSTERRPYRELQQQLYHAVLAEHGVRVSSEGWVADAEDAAAEEGSDKGVWRGDESANAEAGRLAAQKGRYIFENDAAAQAIDVPQKWRRLRVHLERLSFDLANAESRQHEVAQWTHRMRAAINGTVAAWLASDDGRNWAYRQETVRPSHFRDEASWNRFVADIRKTLPPVQDIAPTLDGLLLGVSLEPDLRDDTRSNLRVILENNSADVATRKRHRFEHVIHQTELAVELPVALHRPLKLDRVEPSYRFRDFLTYPAIGINCGVRESRLGDRLRLETTWMPRYQQPRIVPERIDGVPTRFSELGTDGFTPVALRRLCVAYGTWIDTQEQQVDPARGAESAEDADRERAAFKRDVANYRREADRIALGIELLELSCKRFNEEPACDEAKPYRAWLLLNRTFEVAGASRGVEDWRLFQLAFILAHIPTIASRMPVFARSPWFDPTFDEETATLLYFPTGGGKSEAFFGLLVFNLFLDRLRGKTAGITALIRYPLRLLTLQQAQRLLAILVRADLLRRQSGLGGEPFEIGFWVGSGNTPNKPDDPRLAPVPRLDDAKHKGDRDLGPAYREVNESFNKTPRCPLCRRETGLRRVTSGTSEEIAILCFNDSCVWNQQTSRAPLPFLIIDRDIYRHAPAVLLGVIDKLALIGQHPATINRVMGMFGFARWRERDTGRFVMPSRTMLKGGALASNCEPVAPAYSEGVDAFFDPFPSLIIQDEAHLLEESLGTFAGLFETMLEQLFVRSADLLGERVARSPFGSRPARLPKVIAATATVSVPEQQFGALYQRRHMHFPYPGTSIYRSFYAAPALAADGARRGLGGGGPRAPEVEAPWMRTYTSLMTNGRNHTVTTVSVLAAYHLAITELWQDLLSDDRRDAAIRRITSALTPGTPLAPFHERAITSCAQADPAILPTLVDLMRISLTYVTNKKGGDQVIDAFREEVTKTHRRYGRALSQLHTRLVSGGVDVAQIQEIMRDAEGLHEPGDDFPDLQQSLRNIVATSAISHGVDVDKFNAMFFAGMPNDIAEFIQASSRVGRIHVGFSLLIPTPHARRDRYIVETHDVFHRFLERMIAPPAITRWAASAHDRVLTSLFQAWLSGWAEQKLFLARADDDKLRAQTFDTVNDVNRLLTGTDLPGAASDFMEFAVAAIGISGRGADRLGAAPHGEYYDGRIRNLATQLTDELRTQFTTTRLSEYWDGAPVGSRPMMSLRDIDEAGRFVAARPFGGRHLRGEDEKALLAEALRIVRRQSGRVSELDSEEGEG